MGRNRFFRARRLVYLGIVTLVALLNAAAWNSPLFCDWYIANIFPIWVNTYGRFTGIFPFSVGEWLLAAGVILIVLALALGIVWVLIGLTFVFLHAGRFLRLNIASVTACGASSVPGASPEADASSALRFSGVEQPFCPMQVSGTAGKGHRLKRFGRITGGFYRFFLWTLLAVSLVMTLNCFILYHASTFSEHYFGEDTGEYELTELISVYNMVVERCNELSKVMARDDTGMVLYTGSIGKSGEALDMADMARELMRELGEDYGQLDGYYPRPKALLSSDFMCQQYMQGYYFPFSMEANYNDVMHILNIPSTMCHELAHLRGYIYEDEANFIGYLACVKSDDAFFQYAGYLSVLTYLYNDVYQAWKNNPAAYEEAATVVQPVPVESQVWTDNIFVTQEEWDRINGKALIDTEIVDKAADVFIDTNLKVNGIADGKISYSRVVRLLLQYYRINPL